MRLCQRVRWLWVCCVLGGGGGGGTLFVCREGGGGEEVHRALAGSAWVRVNCVSGW